MPEPPPRRFTVGTSAAQRELLKTEAARAIANGLAGEFVAALKYSSFD